MPSHQKACAACANAKRRCDPQLPRCPRCARRGIECSYRNQPLRSSKEASLRQARLRGPERNSVDSYLGSLNTIDSFDTTRPLLEGIFAEDLWTQDSAELGPKIDGSMSLWSESFLSPSQRLGFTQSLQVMVFVDSWTVSTMVHYVTSWPAMFVSNLETPFIHPLYYDNSSMPSPLQEAFSACASYLASTTKNKNIVLDIVGQKASQLVQTNPLLMSTESHMATLQAVFILHIIQLWDGDVRQRAQAEMHLQTLDNWAFQLHDRIMQTTTKLTSVLTWEEWIMLESARRTVLLALLMHGIYEASKFGTCSYVSILAELPVTASDRLWTAKSHDEWKRRLYETSAGVSTYGGFTKLWKEKRDPGPPDTFAKLLLTPCVGSEYKEVLKLPEEIAV